MSAQAQQAGKERPYSVALGLASSHGVTPHDLDPLVHECAQLHSQSDLNDTDDSDEQEAIIEGAERLASNVNNDGLEAQIAFIHSVLGDETEGRICDLINDFPEGPCP